MGQVAHHPDTVHFSDDFTPETRQAAVAFVTAGADQVLRVVAHLHDADAQLLEDLDVADLVFIGMRILETKEDAGLASSLALRMSAVVCTGMTRSLFSRISFWLVQMLLMVA